MLDQWVRYAPNLEADVEHWFTRSPRDTARELPNMEKVIQCAVHSQMVSTLTVVHYFDGRTFAGAGSYRTYLPGLYMCGPATHPGGNVTGLPGHNAAQVILSDLGIKAEWMPPSMEIQLSEMAR